MLHFLWRGDLAILICGVLQRFAALGDKFPLRVKKIWGGSKPRPLCWSVENNRAKMGGQWPPFAPENIFSGFFHEDTGLGGGRGGVN